MRARCGTIRAHEKARSENEGFCEGEARGQAERRPLCQNDDGVRDVPCRQLYARPAQERRLAAVPLPRPVVRQTLQLTPLLLVLGLVAAAPVATAAEDRPLRVVTFNLLHGGPWSGLTGRDDHLEARLALIAAQLRALEPDVVALQESPVSRWRGDVAARLAEALGLAHVHARATERVFGWMPLGRLVMGALGFVEGPAILSRYPIVASAIHELPRCEHRLDPRVALRADLVTPAGLLRVYSTHTSRDDCQTRRVAEVALAERGPLPALVMGDLNTGESAAVLQELREQGFLDLFREANPTALGATVRQDVLAAVSTVRRRVDYLLLLPGSRVKARVLSSRVVLDTPGRRADGSPLWPSDHYGVLAEIGLSPTPAP
ncbi:MAG TPA: endonuclease/exonuclease/phosphatase family protein [Methylomirabilota bacterium]|nr:endonuclease/exonuclease/phosphatase family protein [Methylomirabilota bacterium]